MSDGTWNTAVMDPADVCRLIKDMREQVESVSGTLDVLRAGLTQLEAKVLAIPLPFEAPAGEDSVSDASSQPADTHTPDLSLDGESAVEAPTDESAMAEASAPWQAEAETPVSEARTDEAPWAETPAVEPRTGEFAMAEASAPWQAEAETPVAEARTDEALWAETPAVEAQTGEQPAAESPEVEIVEAPSMDTLVAEAPAYEPEAAVADEPAKESSAVDSAAEPSPEPSWLAAEAALDSIWAPRREYATPEPVASESPEEPKKPSLTGWPDESMWSPSYEWKPMAQQPAEAGAPAEAEPSPAPEDARQVEAAPPEHARTPGRFVDNSWLTSSADASFWPAMATKQPETPEDAQRNQVAEMVSQVRHELTAAAANPGAENETAAAYEPGASLDDEAARREEVARAVERMRSELGYGQPVTPPAAMPEAEAAMPANDAAVTTSETDEEAARREQVARAVVQLREEIDGAGGPEGVNDDAASEQAEPSSEVAPAHEVEAPVDEEAVREEVRRAVEAARAELSGETSAMMAPPAMPAQAASRFSLAGWTAEQERDGPPVIVIKDSDGRVELAHVYEALNRVSCGDSAALLNYTPHSVTIGLPIRAVVPDDAQLVSAFESVFGRPCRVQSDGVRIAVSMGSEHDGRNEEAA